MKLTSIILIAILLTIGAVALYSNRQASPSPTPTPTPTETLSPSPSATPTPTTTPAPSPTATATPTPSPTTTPSPTPTPTTYTVLQGDTLSIITRKFGISLSTLIALNPQLTNPSLIYPGQVITISGTPTTNPNPTPSPTILPEITRGNTSKQQIIFTFDAGAGTQSADAILSALASHGAKATFGLTGKWAEQNPALTKRIATEGHEIINHTYSHPYLTQISDAAIRSELQKTEDIIKNLTGKSTKPYFRAPYGSRNTHVLEVAGREGYRSVFWSVDALDWKSDSTASIVKQQIYNNLKPGAIVLMHVGDSLTGQVLNEVFTEVKSRGYTITSLSGGL